MIYISYYNLKSGLSKERFNDLLNELPVLIQNKINSFWHHRDAERSLIGNSLLMRLMGVAGITSYSLNQIRYTQYQKPYLDDFISFNISHSGDYIICALSKTNKVGIDVEEINDIPMNDFAGLFAKVEWDIVRKSLNVLPDFYSLWTKKEAFLKAVGCGLSQPLNEVVIDQNTIYWQDKQWFLHEILLDKKHIAYLCCDTASPLIVKANIDL